MGQLVGDHVPENVIVEAEIAVGKHITKRCDPSPFDNRMAIGHFGGNLLRGLAKH